jgi:hypothetical protein
MNKFQDSIDPDDPRLDYTPLSLSERAAKLGPSVSQAAMSEPITSPPISRPATLVTGAIDEPGGRTFDRAALLSVAARVGAVSIVVGVVVLVFAFMHSASRQSIASSVPSDDITGSTLLPKEERVELRA